MRTNQLAHKLVLGALSGLLVLALAVPAAAKLVEFTSLLKNGLGDGGNPPTTPSNQPNGLPLCSKGLITHLNASGVGAGVVEVASGAAPQSIMEFRPFKYGSAGPLGPSPTFSMMGAAGINGAAEVKSSTCALAFTAMFLPAILNARTQSTRGAWPAQYTFTTGLKTSPMGGMVTRLITGTMSEQHTLALNRGPGNFVVNVNTAVTQKISGMAGANQFGGGFRATGGGRVNLNVNLGPGVNATGYWLSGPRIAGHNKVATKTQIVTQSGTFTTNVGSNMIPVLLKVWNVPYTTGMVHAEDHGGQFVTIRDTTGNDGRTALGENGTLLLVSPWTANLTALNLYFSGTSTLQFSFLPEPGPTAMLAAGVVGILILHLVSRRRS